MECKVLQFKRKEKPYIPEGNIIFNTGNYPEIIKLTTNGDIYVKGNLIDNDVELLETLREWAYSYKEEHGQG